MTSKAKSQAIHDGGAPRRIAVSIPIAAVAAAIIAIIGIGIGAYWWWNNPWDKERIYEEYNSSVCWTYIAYGYTVTVDGEDFRPFPALYPDALELPQEPIRAAPSKDVDPRRKSLFSIRGLAQFRIELCAPRGSEFL